MQTEEERQNQVLNLAMNKKNIITESVEKRRFRGEPARELFSIQKIIMAPPFHTGSLDFFSI